MYIFYLLIYLTDTFFFFIQQQTHNIAHFSHPYINTQDKTWPVALHSAGSIWNCGAQRHRLELLPVRKCEGKKTPKKTQRRDNTKHSKLFTLAMKTTRELATHTGTFPHSRLGASASTANRGENRHIGSISFSIPD